MRWTPLQFAQDCDQYSGDWIQAWSEFAFREAVVCPYTTNFGGLFVGLIVIGSINAALYAKQESVLLPTVVTLLTGGAWLSQVSGVMSSVVVLMLLFTLGIGPVLVLRRLEKI